MTGKQFSLFMSHKDEFAFSDYLDGVDDIVFLKPSFKGEEFILKTSNRGEVRSFENRRILISSKDFLEDIVFESDKDECFVRINSAISPVIEYDINLYKGDFLLPGRMYCNINNIRTRNISKYGEYVNMILNTSKSNLNKVKNIYGSIIYLGSEMLADFYKGERDFRLL